MKVNGVAVIASLVVMLGVPMVFAQEHPMGFFITSVGLGKGGDLGGLAGADAHCQKLAEAAGAGNRTWRAYLSTEEEGKRGVFARSRIGIGPWYNARNELIAHDLDDLHISPNIFKRTALDEKGNPVNGTSLYGNNRAAVPPMILAISASATTPWQWTRKASNVCR